MDLPTKNAVWTITPSEGFDGLKLDRDRAMPSLDDNACLIKIESASLNYRDIAIPTGRYPMVFKDRVVPCSDGAGIVVATGSRVTMHKVGDRVCTLFNQGHQAGAPTTATRKTSLGSQLDGVLRQYAAFPETGLVSAPQTLSAIEASTLPCAALTAWNALTGIADRSVQPGDVVLTQGTGGVSLFAVQFAVAMGAAVIATTSSDDKAATLKSLGADHIINYKKDPQWGEMAKRLSPDQEGVHHVVEVGGDATMAQSLAAVRSEAVISIIGFLGGRPEQHQARFADCLRTLAIVRGVNVGSREQFEAMNSFIDAHGIKPIVDEKIYDFEDARAAYQYLENQKHFGKIVIDVARS